MSDAVISYIDFEKIKMATGTIISAKINPKARKPAYILKIDFGTEIGVKPVLHRSQTTVWKT